MNNNQKKNVALVIAAITLFLALLDGWQYGFFTILRFVVFFATAYVAWIAYEEHQEKWVWILGSISILFNPFIPIYLTRDVWIVIDLIVGVLLSFSVFILNFKNKHETS